MAIIKNRVHGVPRCGSPGRLLKCQNIFENKTRVFPAPFQPWPANISSPGWLFYEFGTGVEVFGRMIDSESLSGIGNRRDQFLQQHWLLPPGATPPFEESPSANNFLDKQFEELVQDRTLIYNGVRYEDTAYKWPIENTLFRMPVCIHGLFGDVLISELLVDPPEWSSLKKFSSRYYAGPASSDIATINSSVLQQTGFAPDPYWLDGTVPDTAGLCFISFTSVAAITYNNSDPPELEVLDPSVLRGSSCGTTAVQMFDSLGFFKRYVTHIYSTSADDQAFQDQLLQAAIGTCSQFSPWFEFNTVYSNELGTIGTIEAATAYIERCLPTLEQAIRLFQSEMGISDDREF